MTKMMSMSWAGHVARTRIGTHTGYWWESQGKRPLGRQRHRWVDNIKMNLGKIEWDGVNWVVLAQDRGKWSALVNAVMNLWVP
jgi:hypothetical protein